MTIQEFVNTYNGTTIGDGQCVAMVQEYMRSVQNLNPPALGNAHDYYDNFENQPFLVANYNKIPYSNNAPNVRRYSCLEY